MRSISSTGVVKLSPTTICSARSVTDSISALPALSECFASTAGSHQSTLCVPIPMWLRPESLSSRATGCQSSVR